jgi:hypothetical protein
MAPTTSKFTKWECPGDGWKAWEAPGTTLEAGAHRILACSAYGRESIQGPYTWRHIRAVSLSSGLALLSLSLSLPARRRRPPNFLGLRRSTHVTHFGLACGAEGRKQSKRIGGWASALAPAWLCSLSLSARRRPPNFLGLRAAQHPAVLGFGLACGAEGRKQSKHSKQTGDYPLLQGGGRLIWFSAAAVSTACFLLRIA